MSRDSYARAWRDYHRRVEEIRQREIEARAACAKAGIAWGTAECGRFLYERRASAEA